MSETEDVEAVARALWKAGLVVPARYGGADVIYARVLGRLAIQTLDASRAARGMVMVPRVPTEAMLEAGRRAQDQQDTLYADAYAYTAMISARPTTGMADGWRPIKTVPKDGTTVDLWVYWPESDTYRRQADAWFDTDASDWCFGQFHAGQFAERPVVTHWMPPPAAPATGGEG